LARRWGLPRAIIKSHLKEKWESPNSRKAPNNLRVPFNIFAMAEVATAVPDKRYFKMQILM